MPSIGSVGTGDFAGDAQHGAVAAKDQQQIHLARQGGGVGANAGLQAGEAGGGGVAEELAGPPRGSGGPPCVTASAQETFSEFPISPRV